MVVFCPVRLGCVGRKEVKVTGKQLVFLVALFAFQMFHVAMYFTAKSKPEGIAAKTVISIIAAIMIAYVGLLQ